MALKDSFRGNRQLAGTFGKVWFDGEAFLEIDSFEATITGEREDVQIDMDMDSKLVSLKGEGTMKFKKVYSRGLRKYLEAWQSGMDPRSTIQASLDDPDSIGKQAEMITLNNVWLQDLPLMNWEKGKKVEGEYKFGFTPSDTTLDSEIV